jgi:hypothetical protein
MEIKGMKGDGGEMRRLRAPLIPHYYLLIPIFGASRARL